MTSAAPYYQPATSGDFHDTSLTNYTTPADDFANLAAQLAEHGNQQQADQDDAHAQLAGLLQAANSANGPHMLQDAQVQAQPYTPAPAGRGKRKRVSESPGSQTGEAAKRLKQDLTHSSVSAARAAGVHSAAALFRSPAPGSAKKYTRPPMSKLYASLNLTPEDFLYLQAAAKTYMLDPEHPERQDCVGNRAKGDNDMVKLKLFNCVRDFLADGVGEQFFPEDASHGNDNVKDGPGFGDETATAPQKWIWPRDGNQIVSLVTPLMRRMVTNERQRMYAHETRKGGKLGQNGSGADGELLDPTLHEEHLTSPTPNAVADGPHSQRRSAPTAVSGRQAQQAPPPSCSSNVVQFIFTHSDIKLLRFDWPDPDGSPQNAHMTFDKLAKTVSEHASGVKAAMDDAGLLEPAHSFSYIPSQVATLAKLKAAEALAKTGSQQASDDATHVERTSPRTEGAGQPADLSEQLRRELQSQVDDGVGEEPNDQSPDPPYRPGMELLKELGVSIKAFPPSGLTDITTEAQWDAVREEVGKCMWLEGCLRVGVEML